MHSKLEESNSFFGALKDLVLGPQINLLVAGVKKSKEYNEINQNFIPSSWGFKTSLKKVNFSQLAAETCVIRRCDHKQKLEYSRSTPCGTGIYSSICL